MNIVRDKIFIISAALAAAGLIALFFYLSLRPAAAPNSPAPAANFEIKNGDGFREIVGALNSAGLLRSPKVFSFYLILSGGATRLKPGEYGLSASMSAWRIAKLLTSGPDNQVRITIPEGASVFEIDDLLSQNGVFKKGDLVALAKNSKNSIEGKLFPDTYDFYKNSGVEEAVKKMIGNFNAKAAPLLSSKGDFHKNLILASLLEKEVPNFQERRIVAGILTKRLAAGVPLQVDATLCYMKKIEGTDKCYPLTQSDLKEDSPYNTYLYPSWPAGAISNPGLPAIKAALNPETTPYWYFLSDPATGKTIFSNTLDSHNANRVKYLLNS